MSLSDRKEFAFYEFKPGMWDFFRCAKCNAIFTYEEERTRLDHMRRIADTSMYIHCTSHRYGPTQPRGSEWLRLNVARYTVKLFLARGVAPYAERYAPFLLPLLARLVSNKTTR